MNINKTRRLKGLVGSALLAMLLLASVASLIGPTHGAAALAPQSNALDDVHPATSWTFQGRVYEGVQGTEPPVSKALVGVVVSVYGANNSYPDPGTFIRSTTTNSAGWYGLTVYDDDGNWEYYSIRETDPSGYRSSGATSVSGTPRTLNWIEYVIPLDGQTLTGNKFWDQSLTTPTATSQPPTATATPSRTSSRTATRTRTSTLTPTSPAPPTVTHTATSTPTPVEGSITAVVYNDINGNGAQEPGELGLGNVGVALQTSQGAQLATCTTDRDGRCEFTDLGLTTYVVVETDPPGYESTTPNQVAVDLTTVPYGVVSFGDRRLPTATGTASPPPPTPTWTPTATATGTASPPPPTPTRTATPTRTPTGTVSPPPPTQTFTPTSTTSITPTPTSVTPPDCPELLINGDFEQGSLRGWAHGEWVNIGWGHESAHGAHLGGADGVVAELGQTVAFTTEVDSLQLGFWWVAEGEGQQPGDSLSVIMQSEAGEDHLLRLSADGPIGQWQYQALDLTAYAGITAHVTFLAQNDARAPSIFVVDDVTLRACGGPEVTPTPTGTPTMPCSYWSFSGHVRQVTEGGPIPVAGAPVTLLGSFSPDDLGEPLTTTHTLEDGAYGLGCGDGGWEIPGGYEYVHLAITDPHFRVVGAESGSGGQPNDEGWITFREPTPGAHADNDFLVEPQDVIRRAFSGRVCQGPPGDCHDPWPRVPVGLLKAVIDCDKGELVAVVETDDRGLFWFEDLRPAADDSPYWNLAILDEDIRLVGAESASGGHLTNQGLLQFHQPEPRDLGGNDLYANPVLGQQIMPSALWDAYVSAQAPSGNFGSASFMLTGYSSGPDLIRNRAYVQFNLAHVPADAVITKATLNLYLEDAAGEEKVCMSVHRAMSIWYEGSPYLPGITWANQPAYWGSPAGTLLVDKNLGFKAWDITNLVQDWIDGSEYNNGVAVVGPETGPWWTRRWSSKEGSYAPRLVIHILTSSPFNTPTATYTPTPTNTPTPTATPISRQIQVLGVEVTQAIQDINTTQAYLVAGKPAMVRLHLRVADGLGDIPDVYGEMQLNYPFGAKVTPWNAGGIMTVRASPSRDDITHSMDFVLTSKLATGSPFLFFRIFPPAGISFSAIQEYQHTTQVTFMKAVPLNVYLVAVSYDQDGTLRTVRPGAVNDIRSHLTRIMPVPNVNAKPHVYGIKYLDDAEDFCDGDAFSSVNKALAKVRGLTKNVSNSTLFYGMVPDDYGTKCGSGTYVGGRAAGIPSGEASGGVYAAAFDTGDKAAHELSHCMNRYHAADCCGAKGGKPFPYICEISSADGKLRGMDIGSWTVLPWTTKELMSYCDIGSRWMSDYTYDGIFLWLNGSAVPSVPGVKIHGARPAQVESADSLVVSGIMNKTRWTVELDPVYRAEVATQDRPVEGQCAIRLRGPAGGLLAEYPFVPQVNTSLLEGQEEKVVLYEVVPYHPAAAAMDVLCDGRVLASQTASANPPQVTITSPNGGEVWDSGMQTIRWQATDADGDALTFSVQVSRDGGESWDALAVDLEGSSYQLDTTLLAGAENALCKIIVTDGFNSHEDVSDVAFSVAPKPPLVEIDWPGDGATVRADQPMLLRGNAQDPEDGPLQSVEWSSDRDGPLGTGAEVMLSQLSKGWHQISLRARDSDGMEGSATVRAFVGIPLQMPLLLKG